MRQILDDAAPLPEGWGNSQAAGMQVYRGNYRSAILGALGETFERTKLYVGDEPFQRAAINHAIANPPGSWTIDDAGESFDRTCAEMFGNNPEVAEIAWLEWTMLQLATAPDVTPLDAAAFAAATAEFGDEEWTALRVAFQPRAASRIVGHDLTALWQSLDKNEGERPTFSLDHEQGCLVWREGERPTFILVEPDEARAFELMQAGTGYGEVCAMLAGDNADEQAFADAAMRAGAMLGRWLNEGVVIQVID